MTSLQDRQILYGDESELQLVDLWEFPEAERVAAASADRYYFIFLHGGAWRDPYCLTDTAIPTINRLLDDSASPSSSSSSSSSSSYLPRDRIAGFASIGYRLSPHPNFPQNAATTPPYQMRSARHPDHLHDVWTGLAALAADGQGQPGSPADYLAHGRYVVFGHSCGAFLAYQLWMGQAAATAGIPNVAPLPPLVVPLPRALLGLEGIYDLRGLVNRGGNPAHGGGPGTGFQTELQSLSEGAFGPDRAVWDAASPGRFDWSKATPAPAGSGRRLAVLAYSMEDELVDVGEVDTMEQALRSSTDGSIVSLVFRDLHGRHDEIRRDGREVARMLTETVRHLDAL